MSQENVCHGTQEKKGLKTCLPEVEDMQCLSCFELKQGKSEKSKGMLEKRSTQSNFEDNSEERDAKAVTDAVIPSGPASDILHSLNVMLTKQRNKDDTTLYKVMREDLKTYMIENEEDSKKKIDVILIDIEDELNKTFKFYKTPEENSTEKIKGKSMEKIEGISDNTSGEPKNATAKFIENLQKRNKDCVVNFLNSLIKIQQFKASHFVVLNRAVENLCCGETLLHIAFKYDETIDFAIKLIDKCPDLLKKDRRGQYNVGFEGQTPLHVAIVRGNEVAVQNILTAVKDGKLRRNLLKIKSKGCKFNNTVLMGQLPLTVAALSGTRGKFKIMKILLDYGAKIWWKNEYKDTVFHSLIKYADIYPEKIPQLEASFQFLWEKYTEFETHPKDSEKDESGAEEKVNEKKLNTHLKYTSKVKSSSTEGMNETNSIIHSEDTSNGESGSKEEQNKKISNKHSRATSKFKSSSENGMNEKESSMHSDTSEAESSSEEEMDDRKSKSKPEHLLFWKNQSKLTPLHLSAKLGVSELFDCIVDIQYRFTNIQDGLFDIREYDVTEFDRLIDYKEKSDDPQKLTLWERLYDPKKITVLERLFDPKCTHKEAFKLLNQELIAFILRKKWMAYRVPLGFWMILHLLFMTVFTASTTIKAEVLFCFQVNQTICDLGEIFIPPITLYALVLLINLLFGVSYLFFFILCIKKLVERCTNGPGNFGLIWHNLDYVVCLLFVAVGSLLEMFLIALRTHWDFHVILVLICGWYFMIFFSPFSKNLVSFIHMIKKGFLEDFVPFGLVFFYLLVSFTGIMHMVFLGTEEKVDEFSTFQDSLLTMFNLGVGLNNVDVLNQARVPWLAYTVFVVFAILSFIHLFNAFIAVMSQTFSDVHIDKHSYLKYNKLRMIELFEDIVLNEKFIEYLPFLEDAKHWKTLENIANCEKKSKEGNNIDENSIKDKNSKHNKQNSTCKDSKAKNQQSKGKKKRNYDKKRFYTVLHLLDDPNDDISEKEEKKQEPEHKLKSLFKKFKSHASKKHRTNPATETTYVEVSVDYRNRATQFPEMKERSCP